MNDRKLFIEAIQNAKLYAVKYAEEQTEIKKSEAEAVQKKYINEMAVKAHIKDFLGKVKASAATPATPTGFAVLDEVLDEGMLKGYIF